VALLSLFRREHLPTSWASQVLEINPHLLVWRDAGAAMRTLYIQRSTNIF